MNPRKRESLQKVMAAAMVLAGSVLIEPILRQHLGADVR